jgi:hypothetical protein
MGKQYEQERCAESETWEHTTRWRGEMPQVIELERLADFQNFSAFIVFLYIGPMLPSFSPLSY